MPNVFWPYSRRAALLLGLALWIGAGIALAVANAVTGWPNVDTSEWLVLVVLAVGFVPAALIVLDGLRASRATLNLRWFSVDFSQAQLIRESVGIPPNIAAPGVQVDDSGGPAIREALKRAPRNEIVVVDLERGDTWWVTRLLVLAAHAVQEGAPRAFVFLGTLEETKGGTFLGWATPKAVLAGVLDDRPAYRDVYEKASVIAEQFRVFGKGPYLIPYTPPGSTEPQPMPEGYLPIPTGALPDLAQYHDDVSLGYILLTQVADSPLEEPPDRLTISRLNELVGHRIHRGIAVDLDSPGDTQLAAILAGGDDFVAVVRGEAFVGLMRRVDGERQILKRLFEEAQDGAGRVTAGVR